MIEPGSIIGILGGGQLGRMLAHAASKLGYRVHIFTNEKDSPASHVAFKTTVAEYTDTQALEAFAKQVSVATIEFENIPVETVAHVAKHIAVNPGTEVLRICRNRIREKTFVNQHDVETAPFHLVTNLEELRAAALEVGFPCVLKTTEMGYDGKGQEMLHQLGDVEPAWNALKTSEAILEGFVDFRAEISVIIARNEQGEMAVYPPVQNHHRHHILDPTIAPAPINRTLSDQAQNMAKTIAQGLGLIGLLCVEMFVTKDDRLLVNELAPRPHNSGHWTIDACHTSQFEQCVRAVCGLPFGSTARFCDAEMKNLIGDDIAMWHDAVRDPMAKIHLYGKTETRKGRKMGHITYLKLPRSQ